MFQVLQPHHQHQYRVQVIFIINIFGDNVFCPDGHSFHGFFIELKVGYNKPTKNQEEFMMKMAQVGYKVEVIRTFEEFMGTIQEYMWRK